MLFATAALVFGILGVDANRLSPLEASGPADTCYACEFHYSGYTGQLLYASCETEGWAIIGSYYCFASGTFCVEGAIYCQIGMDFAADGRVLAVRRTCDEDEFLAPGVRTASAAWGVARSTLPGVVVPPAG